MKTSYRPSQSLESSAPEATSGRLFTIDQRVVFVNPVTRQRESLPLLTALTTACEYLRVRTPFELVDLDDELLARFDGTQLEARAPLPEVLFATTQALSSIVQKSLSEAFTYLVGEEQARRVLAGLDAAKAAQAETPKASPNADPEAAEMPAETPAPAAPGHPEHLGVFPASKS